MPMPADPRTPPPFRRTAILGVGLIGGSLGMALKNRRLSAEVVGIGRSPEKLDQALSLGAVDSVAVDVEAGVAGADLIVLATPVRRILSDMERIRECAPPDAVVTDVGSTKGEIAEAAARLFPDGRFVPGHPMAGSERSGVEAANPELFIEAVWALTPTPATDADALARVRALFQAVGARVLTMDPERHDRAVAITSHLPHVLAYSLAAVAGDAAARQDHLYDMAAGSFASATRVALSPPEIWSDIAATNRTALLEAIDLFRAELDTVSEALRADDADALLAHFRRGHDAKGNVPG